MSGSNGVGPDSTIASPAEETRQIFTSGSEVIERCLQYPTDLQASLTEGSHLQTPDSRDRAGRPKVTAASRSAATTTPKSMCVIWPKMGGGISVIQAEWARTGKKAQMLSTAFTKIPDHIGTRGLSAKAQQVPAKEEIT